MQASTIYVLKAHLTSLKTATAIQAPLTATLRLGPSLFIPGRSTATATLEHPSSMQTVPLDLELSLHVDEMALQTQRVKYG
jgi:hypothetical protein